MNLEMYETLLKDTASQYAFKKINHDLDTEEIRNKKRSVCFLRHDIDFSPKNAAIMAELEKLHGVSSTYTVLLSGQFYNPFQKNIREMLKKIKNFGHEVGLHFDTKTHNITNEAQLEDAIRKEASALADLLDAPISVFSFHNTNDFLMSCRAHKYGGLVNCYSNFFQNNVEYTSDSNGYWRFRTWKELLLENHKIIQVLTHPLWWEPNNEFPPFETVIKNRVECFDQEIHNYVNYFKDQEVRINQSLLNELLSKINKTNDPNILSLYGKSIELIECLRSGNLNDLFSKLQKISDKLNLK